MRSISRKKAHSNRLGRAACRKRSGVIDNIIPTLPKPKTLLMWYQICFDPKLSSSSPQRID
jgi:hypothetical protein